MKNFISILILLNLSIFSYSQMNSTQINSDSTLYLGPDFGLCVDYIHLLDAGPGFDTYLWQDGSTSQTYLVEEAGTFWVHAFIGSTMYADTINIFYWPYPDPNLGNDTTLCFGSTCLLEPTPGFISYLWQDGSTSPYYVVIDAGLYYVTVSDVHGCVGSDTLIVDYTTNVVDLGSDTIICNCGPSLLLDAGEDFISYDWQDGSTSQFFLVDIEIFGVGAHNYSVSAVDSSNCESMDTILVYIDGHTNLAKTKQEQFQIYPNPANDVINIDLKGLTEEHYSIEILNSYGSVLFQVERDRTQTSDIMSLDISSLNRGIYYLKISCDLEKYSRKLLIKK